jgi:ketosteroid isomerase-like protein
MPRTNPEIIRWFLDAFDRGDVDGLRENVAPGFELDFSRASGPWAGVHGLEDALDLLQGFSENWESVRFEPGELIEAGQRVLVPITVHVQGRDGIAVQARATWVVTIQDGAVEHVCMYQEHPAPEWPGRREALEALGLSE